MMGFIQSAPIYILSFLLVLTTVVTIHELGHFWAAKMFGVAIDRFSIGFGRAIASWTDRSGVEWRIGWMPLGGYVRFSGDENVASVPDQDDLETLRKHIIASEGPEALTRYFHFKPLWQRAIIAVAGPLANFALAIAVFAILLMSVGEMVVLPRVGGVVPDSPASRAGFQTNDLILTAAGQTIESFTDLQQIVSLRSEVAIPFVVVRDGQRVAITATPERTVTPQAFGRDQEIGRIGLEAPHSRKDYIYKRYGPVQAVAGGVDRTWKILGTTVYYLGRIVTGHENGDQLGGPLSIAQASGEVAKMGAEGAMGVGQVILGSGIALFGLIAILSVGIGFMNLLPIPVLDGGHLLFYAYEAIARRPVAARVQAVGYRIGLVLLLGLMLFATRNDLQQFQVFKFIGGLLS